MERHPIKQNFISAGERVSLTEYYRKRKRFFAAFLICASLLVAAFAASLIFGRGASFWRGEPGAYESEDSSLMQESSYPTEEDAETVSVRVELSQTDKREPENDPIAGTPIVSLTLNPSEYGENHINNESIQSTNPDGYLAWDVSCKIGEEPLVLILHTHTTEGYLEKGEVIPKGEIGAATYTKDPAKNVLSVGEVLYRVLNEEGIPAIHCTTLHDGNGRMGAYESAAESIRFFLAHYPSISYVIDLHRDAILTSDGAYVRAVTEAQGESYAQVMAVVGSDGNGTHHPGWEKNLALAQKLRAALNWEVPNLCRPTVLRNASYNQEMSPYAMLLEIGTGGNTVEEAKASAVLVGRALAALIRGK